MRDESTGFFWCSVGVGRCAAYQRGNSEGCGRGSRSAFARGWEWLESDAGVKTFALTAYIIVVPHPQSLSNNCSYIIVVPHQSLSNYTASFIFQRGWEQDYSFNAWMTLYHIRSKRMTLCIIMNNDNATTLQ